jgi:hypothetical protein
MAESIEIAFYLLPLFLFLPLIHHWSLQKRGKRKKATAFDGFCDCRAMPFAPNDKL